MRVIRILSSFERDWRSIPQPIKEEARRCLKLLQENPRHPHLNVKKLANVTPQTWRLRIRGFRILYRCDANAVYLIRILDRKDVYR